MSNTLKRSDGKSAYVAHWIQINLETGEHQHYYEPIVALENRPSSFMERCLIPGTLPHGSFSQVAMVQYDDEDTDAPGCDDLIEADRRGDEPINGYFVGIEINYEGMTVGTRPGVREKQVMGAFKSIAYRVNEHSKKFPDSAFKLGSNFLLAGINAVNAERESRRTRI